MIQQVVEVLKVIGRPASITFILFVLAVGVALAFRRRTERGARWYFVAVVAAYWVLSTPACAERLVEWAGRPYVPLAAAAEARGARIVVVLGAGNNTIQSRGFVLNEVTEEAALRVLEAVRLYRLLDRPTILVSGGITGREVGSAPEGDALRRTAESLGVPASDILVENESKTTREESIVIARMLAGRTAQPIVIVTSPTHMARALAVFRAVGFDPIPSAAAYKSDHSLERYRWAPNDLGLLLFQGFVYDEAAQLYYRARGWMPK
ncbi:MAG: hypothetical protein DMF93_20455 [Acidobacteria bacterium]|nr:MAG: hypothetical protein DMF93_20455 [Acidobacteriota bacterium]